ncbi:MAG TPA: ribonuclease Z [Candidatus Thermoplasmatota archaeon]|nr:ribonuclease Z [Candidatus Thermoplasmatota archaeon]
MPRFAGIHEQMRIVFLGTAGSWPTADRNVSAVALKRGPEVLLFDCGEGTQRQFQRSGLSYMEVSRILVSHLHGDHFLGIAGLAQTMDMNGREAPLHIVGPAGTADAVAQLVRVGHFKPRYPIRVEEVRDGARIDCGDYVISARSLRHNVPNLGYAVTEQQRPGRFNKPRAQELGVPEGPLYGRLQRGEDVTLPDGRVVRSQDVVGAPRRGRKVVYTGDCLPNEATVQLAEGADVLVHDSTFGSDYAAANEYGHSTAAQAAFIASKASVEQLVLTHFSARYRDVAPLVEEARRVFPRTEAAHDLWELEVKFPA